MERLFVSANFYKGNHNIKFVCVRYGNVLGSRGSVVPNFVNQILTGKKITVTDLSMTRFNIVMSQALELILRALNTGTGGEVFVPKLRAYRVGDLKDAIVELMKRDVQTEIISVRPGEKYHESLISKDEVRNTYETNNDYIVFDKQTQFHQFSNINGKKASLKGEYSSDSVQLITKDELKEILLKEKLVPTV